MKTITMTIVMLFAMIGNAQAGEYEDGGMNAMRLSCSIYNIVMAEKYDRPDLEVKGYELNAEWADNLPSGAYSKNYKIGSDDMTKWFKSLGEDGKGMQCFAFFG